MMAIENLPLERSPEDRFRLMPKHAARKLAPLEDESEVGAIWMLRWNPDGSIECIATFNSRHEAELVLVQVILDAVDRERAENHHC